MAEPYVRSRPRSVSYSTGSHVIPEQTLNFSWTDSLVGEKVPRWKHLVKTGANATSEMMATSQEISITPFEARWRVVRVKTGLLVVEGWHRTVSIPVLSTNHPVVASTIASAKQAASADLDRKIREAILEFSGPTFLGELRETLQMMRRPASRAINHWKAFLDKARSVRGRKAFSDLYLEMVYGWLPLMSDVKSAAVALARLSEPARKSVYAQNEIKEMLETSVSGLVSNYTWDRRFTQDQSSVAVSVRSGCGLNRGCIAPSDSIGRLIQLSGFNPREIIPTAWELLPFSFVVDYFTNVDTILKSGWQTSGYATWQSSTIRTLLVADRVITPSQPPHTATVTATASYSAGVVHREIKLVERVRSLPTVTLTFNLPGASQGINLAMLTSSLSRK